MMFIGKRTIIVPIMFLVLLYPVVGLTAEAKMTDIIVTNTRDDLLLYLAVDGAFRPKMTEAVLSGVPTTFSFFISLHQNRPFWFDKKIVDLTVTHAVKFDRLKNEFTVTRSWENTPPTVTESFDHAKKLMTHVDRLKVISLSKLAKGQQYQIRSKAELNKLRLPLYLHYVLFFVSLWDFETDWYTVDFIY
jgi:hypothetical protein